MQRKATTIKTKQNNGKIFKKIKSTQKKNQKESEKRTGEEFARANLGFRCPRENLVNDSQEELL